MKESTSPWFKVIALCTAIGLGGTYVWKQQQKAAPQSDQTAKRMVLSGSKSRIMLPREESGILPELPPEDQEEVKGIPDPKSLDTLTFRQEKEPILFLQPSSKSGIIDLTPEMSKYLIPNPELPVAPKPRTLLPGSKSPARILEPPKTDTVLPSPEIPVAPKQRTLLPGSKSIDSILRAKDLIAPDKKPPAEKP